jgi:hypothetical protein
VKPFTRLVAVVGAVLVGWFLYTRAPRDVVLVYAVGAPDATALEVDLRRGADLVRHAEFTLHGRGEVRHTVRLPDGEYGLVYRVRTPGRVQTGERSVEVSSDTGTVVVPLGR